MTRIFNITKKKNTTCNKRVITVCWNKHSFLSHIVHKHYLYQCVLLHFLPRLPYLSCFLSLSHTHTYIWTRHTQFVLPLTHKHTHTITSCNEWILYVSACVSVCAYWAVEGIITVFILWPSVWPSQRASFSPATVGRWLAGLWNIWITWLDASPPLPPISMQWQTGTQTGKKHTLTDGGIRAAQKLQPLANNSLLSSAPVMHAVDRTLCVCVCISEGVVVVRGGTIVIRSVCLLRSLFCAHWFTSSSLHSPVYLRQSLSY